MPKEEPLTGARLLPLPKILVGKDVAFVARKISFMQSTAMKWAIRKSGEPYIIHPIQVAGIWQN